MNHYIQLSFITSIDNKWLFIVMKHNMKLLLIYVFLLLLKIFFSESNLKHCYSVR